MLQSLSSAQNQLTVTKIPRQWHDLKPVHEHTPSAGEGYQWTNSARQLACLGIPGVCGVIYNLQGCTSVLTTSADYRAASDGLTLRQGCSGVATALQLPRILNTQHVTEHASATQP